MKRFKVVKGNVGGYGGRTFDEGSEVNENDFPDGNAVSLEKTGHLKEISAASGSDSNDGPNYNGTLEADITKKEICKELNALDVEFDQSDNKSDLFELLIKSNIEVPNLS